MGLTTRFINRLRNVQRYARGPGLVRLQQSVEGRAKRSRYVAQLTQRLIRRADLRLFEDTVSSQNGEDGIIREIFRRIGTTNRFVVEFGVETGAVCNAARLVNEESWEGLFIEASSETFDELAERYSGTRVQCLKAFVTSANVEELFTQAKVPSSFDLLSIDIDGNDYWVWDAITSFSPRVVVIEYNASHPPTELWVMAENADHQWDETNYFGASLLSLARLGEVKGYCLVGADSLGINAFFVRKSDAGAFARKPVSKLYNPPGYGMPPMFGHPPGEGAFVRR